MGALHDGHRALLRTARAENGRVVMSLFVNPTQFGPGEDYRRYPRDERPRPRHRSRGGRRRGVRADGRGDVPATASRAPSASASWPTASRAPTAPGHFLGVATVVLKLLLRVEPDHVYFGQKDAQQLAVIRRMVRDLDVPVECAPSPPSANRTASPCPPATSTSTTSSAAGRPACIERSSCVTRSGGGRPRLLRGGRPGHVRTLPGPSGRAAVAAARFGPTRLIDNIVLEAP